MAEPLDPKEIVTVQELAVSNMLEIEAMRELLEVKLIVRGQSVLLNIDGELVLQQDSFV